MGRQRTHIKRKITFTEVTGVENINGQLVDASYRIIGKHDSVSAQNRVRRSHPNFTALNSKVNEKVYQMSISDFMEKSEIVEE